MQRYRPQQEFLFYGNYFYGVCAVAQSVEAMLQQRYVLNGAGYFLLVFAGTVLYYDYPYARKYKADGGNPRIAWYIAHYRFVWWNQVVITAILSCALAMLTYQHLDFLLEMSLLNWVLLIIFPVVASLYYGINFLSRRYNLRAIGWLKPFTIGFIWSGLVAIYPVLYYNITHQQDYTVTVIGSLLFVKNFMFISLLAIMFDVKDYAADHASRLRTIVVKFGLRRTVFFILLPLPVLGLLTFIYYGSTHDFQVMKIILNAIPFILLLMAARSLRRRRTMMYYLVMIDGLMLVKALCGITAMVFF
jgi:hypothetical protein